jgi:hypothetical protein
MTVKPIEKNVPELELEPEVDKTDIFAKKVGSIFISFFFSSYEFIRSKIFKEFSKETLIDKASA